MAKRDYFNNDSQERRLNEMLLHYDEFYDDEFGDAIVNQAYDDYLADNYFNDYDDWYLNEVYDEYLRNLFRVVQHDHDYGRNVSISIKFSVK